MYKLRLAAMAAMLVFSGIAVTRAAIHQKDDVVEWHLKSGQDPNQASSYELSSTAPPFTCSPGTFICTIMDVADPSNPSEPALSHGTVTSNESAYQATSRDEE